MKNKIFRFSNIFSVLAVILAAGALVFSILSYNNLKNNKAEIPAVSAYIKADTEDYCEIGINNLGKTPIYNVVARVVFLNYNGSNAQDARDAKDSQPRGLLSTVPNGKYVVRKNAIEHGMSKSFGVEIAFRDANGNSYKITGDGHLMKIDKDPLEYYKIDQPYGFEKLTEVK